MVILGTNTERFRTWHKTQGAEGMNGAYWYSKEIEDIILPELDSDAVVVTVAASLYGPNDIPSGSVIVCHDNRYTEQSYGNHFGNNHLWICSKESTVKTLKGYGENAVYVPLSIDTRYVKKFITDKTKDTAYVGNPWGFKKEYLESLPPNIKQLGGMERDVLLRKMAEYKNVIAEGRCLMEAQVLGAKTSVPEYKEHEAVFVKALDSLAAVKHWQKAFKKVPKRTGALVEVLTMFTDTESSLTRKAGDVFEVKSKERLKALLNSGFVKKVKS